MEEKVKIEEPGETRTTEVNQKIVVHPVCPTFTKAESAVVMALIRSGWSTAVLGSRKGFELLAAVEDKMNAAGAVANELPDIKGHPGHPGDRL